MTDSPDTAAGDVGLAAPVERAADQFTPERALELLRKADVNLQEFVSNPKVFDSACKTIHRMLPPPARWVLREKGVRRVLQRARDVYLRTEQTARDDEYKPA